MNTAPPYHEDDDDSRLEARIAIIEAALSSSRELNKLRKPEIEPYDIPGEMMPVAYAMFQFLVKKGHATGGMDAWTIFLQQALDEVIARFPDSPEAHENA